MPLTGRQITYLVAEIGEQWTFEKLKLSADNLGFQLDAGPGLAKAAVELITHFNSRIPPRDGELLDELYAEGNARLRAVVDELRRPTFYSPTQKPVDAILLGKTAFVGRAGLRAQLADFINPSPLSTRILVVRGDEPCGKSYSWEFLRHISWAAVGATALRLRLKDTAYTPRQLFEEAFRLLNLDASKLPLLTDDPQLARTEPLINAFKGQLPLMNGPPYWLVLDDLNDPSVLPETREAALALAHAVEEVRPTYLWVALLGYNTPITDGELRHVAQDDASFPDRDCVAVHLQAMASEGPKPITAAEAERYADLLFAKYPAPDKTAMIALTPRVETLGARLRLGERPEAES